MRSVRQIAKLFEPFCVYSSVLLTDITFSREHLVPVSKLKTAEARMDLINIYPCDLALNLKRSCYKFTEGDQIFINTKQKTFVPGEQSKGLIARTCLYMHELHGVDLTGVIDDDVLNLWLAHEISGYEIRHSALIEYCKKKL